MKRAFTFFRQKTEALPRSSVSQLRGPGEKTIKISNPAYRNALSVPILNEMVSCLSRSDEREKIIFDFDTRQSPVTCAGFNLFDFNVEDIAAGADPLPPAHPGCILLQEIYQRSKRQPVEFVADKHLIGFGLVLAAATNTIRWGNPENIKIFLPHFRVGIGFPLLPIFILMERFGVPVVTELLIEDRAIPLDEFLEKIQENRRTSVEQKHLAIQSSQDRLYKFVKEQPHHLRTSTQTEVAKLHIDQINLFLKYGGVENVPLTLQQLYEQRRLSTAGPSLAASISKHRENMHEVNHHASKDIKRR